MLWQGRRLRRHRRDRGRERLLRLQGEWLKADEAVADMDCSDTFDVAGEAFSLRMVYVHMTGEYARHNGHADLLRECIDGRTGR